MPYLDARASDFHRRVSLPEVRAVIGRGQGADLRIPHPSISKVHASIEPVGSGRFLLVDLESSNGIKVAGARCDRMEIGIGESFQLGKVAIELRLAKKEAPRPAAPTVSDRVEKAPLMVATAPSKGGLWQRSERRLGLALAAVLILLGAAFWWMPKETRGTADNGAKISPNEIDEGGEDDNEDDTGPRPRDRDSESSTPSLLADEEERSEAWMALGHELDSSCADGGCHRSHRELDFVPVLGAPHWGRWERNLLWTRSHGGWRREGDAWFVSAHPASVPPLRIEDEGASDALRLLQLGNERVLGATGHDLGMPVPVQSSARIPLDSVVTQQNAWVLLLGRLPTAAELLKHAPGTPSDWLRHAKQEPEFWRERARRMLMGRVGTPLHGAFPIPGPLAPESVPDRLNAWYDMLGILAGRAGSPRDGFRPEPKLLDEDVFDGEFLEALRRLGGTPIPLNHSAQLLKSAWSVLWGEPPSVRIEELLFEPLSSGLDATGVTPRLLSLLAHAPTLRIPLDAADEETWLQGVSRLCSGKELSMSALESLSREIQRDSQIKRLLLEELLLSRWQPAAPSPSTAEPVRLHLRVEIVCDFPVRPLLANPKNIPRLWKRLRNAKLQIFSPSTGGPREWVTRALSLGSAKGVVVVPDKSWIGETDFPERWRIADGRLLLGARALSDAVGEPRLPENPRRDFIRDLLVQRSRTASNSATDLLFERGGYRWVSGAWENGIYAPSTRTLLLAQAQLQASRQDELARRNPLVVAVPLHTAPSDAISKEWDELFTTIDLLDLESRCAMELWFWGTTRVESIAAGGDGAVEGDDEGTAESSGEVAGHDAFRVSWGLTPERGWVLHSEEPAAAHHPLLRSVTSGPPSTVDVDGGSERGGR